MSATDNRGPQPAPSEEVRAKAAAWVAELHDEERSPDLGARLQVWLDESEEHRRAFSRMRRIWQQSAAIRIRARGDESSAGSAASPVGSWVAAAAAALFLAVVATVYYVHGNAMVTGVGQRQVRLLPDGTRVVMNTDTRIEVDYSERLRRVRLIHGEAWFEVSHRPSWPFAVTAGSEEVRALGTSFIVRHDDIQDLAVTLIEGRVSIGPGAVRGELPAVDQQFLAPGERLIFSQYRPRVVDRPELARITAWQHGQVEFEQTPLGEAAQEMNRYSTTHVIVADPRVAQLRVGGIFRAGDSGEFVRVVATAFGLQSKQTGDDIVLSRAPDVPRALMGTEH